MTFKKNWFCYVLWAFFAAACVAGYIGLALRFTENWPIPHVYTQIGMVCLSFLLIAAMFVWVRYLVEFLLPSAQKINSGGWEAMLAILLLGVGIVLRVLFMESTGGSSYYEAAKVTGTAVTPIAYGAQYYYIMLLRGLFMVVGNHFTAGIYMQIFLQAAAFFVWYLAVKKISGSSSALIFLGIAALLPESIREGVRYSPRMLYLLFFGLGLLFVGMFLEKHVDREPFAAGHWFMTFITGVMIGFIAYTDIAGMLLFLPLLFVFLLPNGKGMQIVGKLCVILFGFAGAVMLCFGVNAMISQVPLATTISVWAELFIPYGRTIEMVVSKAGLWMAEQSSLEAVFIQVLAFVMLLGIPMFFVHKKKDYQGIWTLLTLGVVGFYMAGFRPASNQYDCLFMASVAALLGTTLRMAFAKVEKKQPEAVEIEEIKAEENKTERIEEEETMEIQASMESDLLSEVMIDISEEKLPEKKVKFIENPLPLPRKHVKKALNFPRAVSEEQMHYDIEVSEEDDFDLL